MNGIALEPELIAPRSASDLRPGDVVFWHSRNPWARLIQRIDRTRWNHASIVVGLDMAAAAVWHVESEKRGVVMDLVSFEKLRKPGRTAIVRPLDQKAPFLGERAAAAARRYLGRPYAAHTLALLAGVLLARSGKLPRLVGQGCAWLAARGGKQSLVCSELVRRAWRDVGVDLNLGDPDLATPGDLWRSLMLWRDDALRAIATLRAREIAREVDDEVVEEIARQMKVLADLSEKHKSRTYPPDCKA